MSKILYVLISDGEDGSYYPHFTFNGEWIAKMEETAEYGDIGVDGDGFHYETLILPDECTLESLGIYGDVSVGYGE